MARSDQPRTIASVYVTAVVLAGAAVLAHSVHSLYVDPIGKQWFVLATLTLLTGSFTVKVPSTNASLSVSETFVFASVLLFGAAAGAITVLLECLIILFWMKPQRRSVRVVLFNMAAPAIAIWVAASIFFVTSGIQPYSKHGTPLPSLFIPLLALTAIYFLLNSWLVAIALAFETGQDAVQIWWTNFTWLSVNYFSGASVAALIVTYKPELDASTLAIIVPLLVVSYLTFRTAMGRVEDSNKHLSELNRLYLSTIETLAMAIDAKDQITHGHIRRVQTYAVGLAKTVGVADKQLIRAIEAAALLHDMGKLAVPEYILNKPGKLTSAEFEKMKLHASVGADILSAIEFPYPVVPIVRHHHENWDGTGYPAQLKGTDIPIGARILSVVDCFDALTSDRPYRPRLSDDEALKILIERRGSMYDPLVVDTFLRVHKDIAPRAIAVDAPRHALLEITNSGQLSLAGTPEVLRLNEIAASADEMLTLYDLARTLGGHANIADTGDVMVKHLRRLIPFSLAVLFFYDSTSDELEARYASGENSELLHGFRIPRGQRLSGWVAANRQTIMNSDPTLDFGDVARSAPIRLRSCLSTPLVADDQLVGVLTLYSGAVDGFAEDHRRIIEAVARQLAHTFRSAAEFHDSSNRDQLTGLPNSKQLEQLLEAGSVDGGFEGGTLLFIGISGLSQIAVQHSRRFADDAVRHVVRCARSGLRVTDILFRRQDDEFIAFLNNTDLRTAKLIGERIQQSIDRTPVVTGSTVLSVNVRIASVSIPQDGRSLSELVSAAYKGVAPAPTPSPNIH